MSNENEKSLETVMDEIKKIIVQLEKNDLPIDQAIDCFGEGIRLVRNAEQQLKDVKDRVTKIVKEGNVSEFKIDNA